MRLYDLILQQANTSVDKLYYGLIGNFAGALREAQCFELSPQVVAACSAVAASKPSSILAATPMLRLPYQSIWLEWYGDRGDYMRHNQKVIPSRLGCYIESINKVNNRGYAYWAWVHDKDQVTIAPFSIAFDWDPAGGEESIKRLITGYELPAHLLSTLSKRFGSVGNAQAILINTEKWYNQADANIKERDAFIKLERRAAIVPNRYAQHFIKRYNLLDPDNPKMAEYTDDVCGELPFVEAFVIMLNSRHILERNTEDLIKLNKARTKQRKPTLREFTVTNLRLTRTTENRLKAGGMDRAAARIHLVRGHFKVRSSGVYWWSPFTRGRKAPVSRKEYKVE